MHKKNIAGARMSILTESPVNSNSACIMAEPERIRSQLASVVKHGLCKGAEAIAHGGLQSSDAGNSYSVGLGLLNPNFTGPLEDWTEVEEYRPCVGPNEDIYHHHIVAPYIFRGRDRILMIRRDASLDTLVMKKWPAEVILQQYLINAFFGNSSFYASGIGYLSLTEESNSGNVFASVFFIVELKESDYDCLTAWKAEAVLGEYNCSINIPQDRIKYILVPEWLWPIAADVGFSGEVISISTQAKEGSKYYDKAHPNYWQVTQRIIEEHGSSPPLFGHIMRLPWHPS